MTSLIIFAAKYLIYIIVALFLVYFFFIARKRTKRRMLILSFISLPVTYLLGWFAGHLYYDPRPFVVNGTQPLISHAADNGFPSDHTLLGIALASIVFTYNRPVGILLGILALAVGVARVAAGVHHTVDIVGGAFLAIVAVGAVYLCIRRALWYRG